MLINYYLSPALHKHDSAYLYNLQNRVPTYLKYNDDVDIFHYIIKNFMWYLNTSELHSWTSARNKRSHYNLGRDLCVMFLGKTLSSLRHSSKRPRKDGYWYMVNCQQNVKSLFRLRLTCSLLREGGRVNNTPNHFKLRKSWGFFRKYLKNPLNMRLLVKCLESLPRNASFDNILN